LAISKYNTYKFNKKYMHVKKGDKVIVIAGKEKGKSSTVAKVLREENRVVLEGLNMMKKHVKAPKPGEKGGIVDIAMPIHASNVKLADKTVKQAKPAAKAKKAVAKKA
jgi:large subunit ribosomal protein L24